jgi:lipopolysaccharide export system protein LptC
VDFSRPRPGHIRRRQCPGGPVKIGCPPESGQPPKGNSRLTIAYPVDAARGAAFSASARGDIERNYRTALRHSRRVRWLRLGVPVGIAAALLMVVAANYAPIDGFRLPGELGKLVIKGTKITMQRPRLNGFTADARPYEFTASDAAQDVSRPDFMELQEPRGKMQMQDKSTVNMSAHSGTYDMKTEMLTLKDDIHLVSSTGYEARLSEAAVDMRKGEVVTDKPVWVKLLNGVLNAKRLEVVDNGNLVRFGGGVAMTLQPEQSSKKASER